MRSFLKPDREVRPSSLEMRKECGFCSQEYPKSQVTATYTAQCLVDAYRLLALNGSHLSALRCPSLDVTQMSYFKQRLEVLTLCDDCSDLVLKTLKKPKLRFQMDVLPGSKLSEIEGDREFFCARIMVGSLGEYARYRVLGTDFALQPAQVNLLHVFAEEAVEIQRVLSYYLKLKVIFGKEAVQMEPSQNV